MTAICRGKQPGLKAILAIVTCCIFVLISGCLSLENKKDDDSENIALEIMANPVKGIMPLNVSFSINTKKDKKDIMAMYTDRRIEAEEAGDLGGD